ncbi:MAG: cell division protein ZapE [Rhizobiales bacterium]|nr:cell division protein ZapE [Hyphomicrobiales bacterium]
MAKGPLKAYRDKIKKGEIAADPAQALVAEHLQRLADMLAGWRPGRRLGPLAMFGIGRKVTPPEGLYIWGGVGRGKSMLMDLFFEKVAVSPKRRVHFHAFMQETHGLIHDWRQREKAGKVKGADPIPPVAAQIASKASLLCFDEFQVHDIADASILGRLFEHLFELGVVVVTTSNRPPDDLYKGGLNRQRFLPFIDLVKDRMTVLLLDSQTDYRLDRIKGLPVYYTPLDAASDRALDETFFKLTDRKKGDPAVLDVRGRALDVPEACHGVARFTFRDLCARPLGAADYLKLAETYHTVILKDVPAMGPELRNEAKRFVTLIDALYEAKTKLILSAAVPATALYEAGDGAFEFERTVSRLIEMQSSDYFSLRAAD